MREILEQPFEKAVPELEQLAVAYSNEKYLADYCLAMASGCYVAMGKYEMALTVYPMPPLGNRSTTCTDDVLSLKVLVGQRISGHDVMTLNGPKITKWGLEHIDEVAAYLDIIVRAYEKNNGVNLIEEWSKSSRRYDYQPFRGTSVTVEVDVSCYSFSRNPETIRFIRKITREAENSVREERQIPMVGEGWVGETNLYYELKKALAPLEVIHHASPEWLGRQHLDIYIPEWNVAVEYQGAQHDQPVEYFGGEEAYKKTQRRDKKKMCLCKKNGVRLIYVREGYNLNELLEQIRSP